MCRRTEIQVLDFQVRSLLPRLGIRVFHRVRGSGRHVAHHRRYMHAEKRRFSAGRNAGKPSGVYTSSPQFGRRAVREPFPISLKI